MRASYLIPAESPKKYRVSQNPINTYERLMTSALPGDLHVDTMSQNSKTSWTGLIVRSVYISHMFTLDTCPLHFLAIREGLSLYDVDTLHRKKSFSIFPSPAGMSLTKLSLGGKNLFMTSLFPPRDSLVRDIPSGDGDIEKLLLRCIQIFVPYFI
jgi:hypothetical protein